MLFDFLSPLLPFTITVIMMAVAPFIGPLNRSVWAMGVYFLLALVVGSGLSVYFMGDW